MRGRLIAISTSLVILSATTGLGQTSTAWQRLQARALQWEASEPILAPAVRPADPCVSVKDPSIVRFGDRWHLFTTIRSKVRSHQIEYVSFADWGQANQAERHVLQICPGYFCAPQVFFFRPWGKWVLLFQTTDPSRKVALQPAISTNPTLDNPHTWSPPTLLFEQHPASVDRWIDFWIICDDAKAHLFFTSNDGRFWRSETPLASFPKNWSAPTVVLRDDLFEASHTYHVAGVNQYLTIVESLKKDGGRFYRAYTAERLDGAWKPAPNDVGKPFANEANVRFSGSKWTQSISHGELIRTGVDERMEIANDSFTFLFQGVAETDRAGKPYGQIPWRLGLLQSR